jgi:beta-glucosidase
VKLIPVGLMYHKTIHSQILGLLKRAYASGIPFDGPEEGIDTPELRSLLRTAAASAVVLLKNEAGALPLDSSALQGKTIAVIGPNAAVAMASGGGSARLLPTYTISPLDGITAVAEAAGAKVVYAKGASTAKFLPTLDRAFANAEGAHMSFWNAEPSEGWLNASEVAVPPNAEPVWTCTTKSADAFLADGVDETKVNEICWLSVSSEAISSMLSSSRLNIPKQYKVEFIVDESGDWEFGTTIAGIGNVYLDGKLIIDFSTNPERGEAFFGLGTPDGRAHVSGLEKGSKHEIEVRGCNGRLVTGGAPFTCWGGLRLGGSKAWTVQEAKEDALEVAKSADVRILVVGLNHDFESEGFDRPDMEWVPIASSF